MTSSCGDHVASSFLDVILITGEVSNELRETISTLAVMRSCATDPGHIILLTGELINWIIAGLTAKYGITLEDLPEEEYAMIDASSEDSYISRWEDAIDNYNASRSFWGHALKMCRWVSSGMLQIAIHEDLLDYSLVSQSFTSAMQGMKILDEGEEEKKVDTTKKYGYGNKRDA
jgi:hypothetical protein